MLVTVKYFGQLRHMTRAEGEECDQPDACTVKEALASLAKRHGEDYASILFDEAGELRPSVTILVNGDPIDGACPPALKAGDEVKVFPPIAGG